MRTTALALYGLFLLLLLIPYASFAQGVDETRGTPPETLIFQSRAPGSMGGGQTLSASIFSGHNFRVTERTQVSSVGIYAQAFAPHSVFLALYRVDTPDSAPDVVGDSALQAVSLLEVPGSGVPTEVSGAMSVILEPGWYALVVGSGRHGATAPMFAVSLINTGTTTTAQSRGSYTVHSGTNVLTLSSATTRLSVLGYTLPPVPLPATQFLMETARPSAWWTSSGLQVGGGQFLATRFSIDKTVQVEQVSAWMLVSNGSFFAAILPLASGTSLPPNIGTPAFQNSVLGTALIQAQSATNAYHGEFNSLKLPPGHYALVLGSQMFGATGTGSVVGVQDQIVLPGTQVSVGSTWGSINSTHWMSLRGSIPELEVSPDPVDFGEVLVGGSGTRSITASNLRDGGSLLLTELNLAGGDASQFVLGADAADCLGVPIAAQCSFTIHFEPDQIGVQTALLNVVSDGIPNPYVITLDGTGIASASVTPSVAGQGQIAPNTPQLVAQGSNVVFLLTPSPGHDLDAVVGSCGGELLGNSYTTNPVTGDCTVIARFIPRTTTSVSPSVNPARLDQPVLFTAQVAGVGGAPAAGQVQLNVSTGESCSDSSPPDIVGNVANFSCAISFDTLGPRSIQASYSASSSHSGSSSTPSSFAVMRIADLAISIEDGQTTVDPGDPVAYLVEVRNAGPDAAPGSDVLVGVSTALLGTSWSCTSVGSASCPAASGGGPINEQVDLPADGGLDYLLLGQLGEALPATVVATAQAVVDANAANFVFDPNGNDNQSSDVNIVDPLLADGFE